jgi:hypothetical protein
MARPHVHDLSTFYQRLGSELVVVQDRNGLEAPLKRWLPIAAALKFLVERATGCAHF